MLQSHPKRSRPAAVGLAAALAMSLGAVSQPATAAAPPACLATDLEYRINASVLVRDTLFGAADGVYPLGSGTMRLRMAGDSGPRSVQLISYDLVGQLTVEAKVAMFSTKVVTESRASAGVSSCEERAEGTLEERTLTWSTPVEGYRSEGTITCTGNMCGHFGAPPDGRSPIPPAAGAMRFGTFTFSPDGTTFTMPYTLVSRSTSPRQSTYTALSGRLVRRSCVTGATGSCQPPTAKLTRGVSTPPA